MKSDKMVREEGGGGEDVTTKGGGGREGWSWSYREGWRHTAFQGIFVKKQNGRMAIWGSSHRQPWRGLGGKVDLIVLEIWIANNKT